MGLSGPSQNQKNTQVAQATTPYSTLSPFGQTVVDRGQHQAFNTPYTDAWAPYQPQIFQTENTKIGQLAGSLPTSFTAADLYDNPFYKSTSDLLTAPINRQYQQQQQQLNNSLNAQNQLGSSYDALQHNYLNQQYNYDLTNAQNQARASALQAYGQANQMGLQNLAGIRGDYMNAQNQVMQPFALNNQFQQTMTPLQSDLASVYAAQPTGYQNILSGINTAANVVNAFNPFHSGGGGGYNASNGGASSIYSIFPGY